MSDATLLRLPLRILAGALVVLAACDGDTDGNKDIGMSIPVDSGPPPDSGVRALCPVDMNVACTTAADCGMGEPKSSNCVGCMAYNNNICELGTCPMAPKLESGDPINVDFQLDAVLFNQVKSFVYTAVANESSGGNYITCADIVAKRVDLTNGCYNILTSRGKTFNNAMGGNQPTMTFTRFVADRRTLFIVYGYAEDQQQQTTPIGVACAEHDVGPPGQGRQDIDGGMMDLIQ